MSDFTKSISNEIKVQIISYLDPESKVSLSQTNFAWYGIVSNDKEILLHQRAYESGCSAVIMAIEMDFVEYLEHYYQKLFEDNNRHVRLGYSSHVYTRTHMSNTLFVYFTHALEYLSIKCINYIVNIDKSICSSAKFYTELFKLGDVEVISWAMKNICDVDDLFEMSEPSVFLAIVNFPNFDDIKRLFTFSPVEFYKRILKCSAARKLKIDVFKALSKFSQFNSINIDHLVFALPTQNIELLEYLFEIGINIDGDYFIYALEVGCTKVVFWSYEKGILTQLYNQGRFPLSNLLGCRYEEIFMSLVTDDDDLWALLKEAIYNIKCMHRVVERDLIRRLKAIHGESGFYAHENYKGLREPGDEWYKSDLFM
jgi:hypothetical protein